MHYQKAAYIDIVLRLGVVEMSEVLNICALPILPTQFILNILRFI